MNPLTILGIETSCDETAVAVVKNGTHVLANVLSSSLPLHAKTGGVIPEIASREQIKSIVPAIEICLQKAGVMRYGEKTPEIDALAVTFGPGLIGSLLVGVEAAKTLSFVWEKPLVPVNHLIGHFYSAWIENLKPPKFPVIALVVSGGHTELLLAHDHGRYKHLGGTLDDAAGEAFDKTARLLGLGYPGGPAIEAASKTGDPKKYNLPRPLMNDPNLNFSFSGFKTAVVRLVEGLGKRALDKPVVADLSASIQEAIIDILVAKTHKAAGKFEVGSIVLGGGVAANTRLRGKMTKTFGDHVHYSNPELSTDNAAMIASAAYFNFKPQSWEGVKADPSVLF
ncbi:MAG: tRNA (adenosine(37)-N6)-threonylcarbamoyltransferase complex transferase subunit TsaD [Candidatus Woykebacteria bacterium RBG_19FT_COMBO_43_10]|uniref:tRNA N6-adenosine threonylcarbamoyltransferase n=1 Tax=Candidatus Woykebacteria bacterium RBG_19FT_COMBO_43_10 TaxID=1802598 RepID=A0A1G1WH94_9BACT|nr:MAG: tRNA (adenosine(37)-N6)-threonylcarbamoyltransferase complex transferase subunit TsaD [Candidatus Woykebacteria bacterium RBG_19FT_COMBO_43_10]